MIWRIRDRRAFQELARTGRRARTKTLWCSYINDPAAVPLRVAYALGRAVGPATARNRLRRRLRAIVAAVESRLDVHHGQLLIGARLGATEQTFAALTDEVTRLFQQVTSQSPPTAARRCGHR